MTARDVARAAFVFIACFSLPAALLADTEPALPTPAESACMFEGRYPDLDDVEHYADCLVRRRPNGPVLVLKLGK